MIGPVLGAAIAVGFFLPGCRSEEPRVPLGPKDGLDLPPADTGRVKLGDVAPDFSLGSHRGEVVTLSDFRGRKDVVLVFYRGHW